MSEKTLHRGVSDYIRYQYPGVIFNTDLSGAMRLTIGQAKAFKNLRSSRAFPDLMIYEPRANFKGLFIELKKEGQYIYKKRTQEYVNEHVREQAEMIQRLTVRGYCACFCIGFDQAKKVIDEYLKLK